MLHVRKRAALICLRLIEHTTTYRLKEVAVDNGYCRVGLGMGKGTPARGASEGAGVHVGT